MGRLFGTDGVRGVANTELTGELAMALGRAAAVVLAEEQHRAPKILIGKDTRVSCDMLESALAAGFCSVGADVVLVGVLPTPAVAFLVGELGADAGVMISASHNPAADNGIKIFSGEGFKLPDEVEEKIEALVLDHPEQIALAAGDRTGRVTTDDIAVLRYIDHVKAAALCRFDDLRVVIDCANGSASVTARRIFDALGAHCLILSDLPDGRNINHNCGSTHLENLRRAVVETGADMGLAFDGDADRLLMIDHDGNLVDGDKLIAIMALHLRAAGKLAADTAVVTVMSNLGFFKFCEAQGIATAVTKVGDRYILEEMREKNYCLGGEQSGHIILLDLATTGDGQLSAVMILSIAAQSRKTLKELAAVMNTYPQTLLGIRTTPEGKAKFEADAEIKAHVAERNEQLAGDGRILVRVSGTEPLIRVMVEGKDQAEIEALAESVADYIRGRIGA